MVWILYFVVPGSRGSELTSRHSSGSLPARADAGEVFGDLVWPSTTSVRRVGKRWELTTLTLSRKPLNAAWSGVPGLMATSMRLVCLVEL